MTESMCIECRRPIVREAWGWRHETPGSIDGVGHPVVPAREEIDMSNVHKTSGAWAGTWEL
jgi:hypothetical protein